MVLALWATSHFAAADVEVHLTGASGFRDTAYFAIRSLFGADLISQNPADGPSAPLQLKVNWTGRIPAIFGEQTVTVRAYYNNVYPGIQDLTLNRDVAFLASANPGDTNIVGPGFKSDIVFSSLYQQSTPFRTPVLEDIIFGATALALVKSSSAPASLTNITTRQLAVLAANGAVPSWFLTGNTNETTPIHFLNRDPGAGQRVALFKEARFTGSPISYIWDAGAGGFVHDPVGRTSAAEIRNNLNLFGPAIGYLTMLDAFGVAGGANLLSYNGVLPITNRPFNDVENDYSPVFNGQYSLWVYEHLLNRPTASSDVRAFRDALVTTIKLKLETAAFSVPLHRFRVERSFDGGPLVPIK